MSHTIYGGVGSYFHPQVWLPCVCLLLIAITFHQHDILERNEVLSHALTGSMAIGYSIALGVIIGTISLGVFDIALLAIFQVSVLGALGGILLFSLYGILNDFFVFLIISLLGVDLGLQLTVMHIGIPLSILIAITFLGILINFFLNYRMSYQYDAISYFSDLP